ncbi:hypothetical protein [Xenorhabdus bovienii]|nr:hypothetical protein [Xenorhabdus bovienii]
MTGLKDDHRFQWPAPSCALLFPPYGLPMSFPLLWPRSLIPRLTFSSG